MRRLPDLRETLPLSGCRAFTHMEGPSADRSEGITDRICIPGIDQGMKYIDPHEYQQVRSYPSISVLLLSRYF